MTYDRTVNAVCRQGSIELAVDVVFHRAKQRTAGIVFVTRQLEIFFDARQGGRMRRHKANLTALAMHSEMLDPAPILHVANFERA